jgi:DNA-binding protein Fis
MGRSKLNQDPDSIRQGPMVPVHVGMTLDEVKKHFLEATMRHTHGDISKAAALLGINRTTIYGLLRRYGLARWG